MAKTFVPGEILTASDVNNFLVSKIIDVKHALKTDAQTLTSVSAGGNAAVTGLSITHEVRDPANQLIITAFFGAAATSGGRGNVGIAINEQDGATNRLLAIGDAAGSRTRVSAGGLVSVNTANYVVTMPSITFVHTPGAGSKTFTVRAVNIATGTQTLYVNRSELDIDNSERPRAVSSLLIQEVAV